MKGSKGKPWWKDQEQLSVVFERALRPLEELRHNVKTRDTVGFLRQLDVGIMDKDRKKVHGLVEVQKRTKKVSLQEFGGWIYKLKSIEGARTLTALAEAGFVKSVVAHARKKFPKTVRLARIHPVDKANAGPGFTSLTWQDTVWDITGAFYQTVDDKIGGLPSYGEQILEEERPASAETGEPPTRDRVSVSEILIANHQAGLLDVVVGNTNALILKMDGPIRVFYQGEELRRLMVSARISHKVSVRDGQVFAYDEVFPKAERRGVCLVVDLVIAGRMATLQLVSIPHGQDVKFFGQIQLHDP